MKEYQEIEALLFIVGQEGIRLEELSTILNRSQTVVHTQLMELAKRYEEDDQSALCILEVGQQFILSTKQLLAPLLKEYARSPLSGRLSQAALETLAIIAYKQPITRVEIETIRGVKASGSLQKLVALQLVEEKGRVDGPGRAILYGTSAYFMNYFGLKDLTELPDLEVMSADLEEPIQDLFQPITQIEENE
ncbi:MULTISPECIES: SMC-Scp complex subunit ScpB [Enterococcus]|uniref:Segregation and condensation protein B n=1 Tax=Enterococcus sulfureus ATCC 49903 TaxID=1140003 RepID=S0P6N9_9ENTE|nr:SMC-Scp complex subunit ScpB [Enterococcus sulfureus]EOT47988.1 segregation and condensation protein B [Enterococcus sulfureus ATCC 49903]EOT84156.1 segregation and condensation protein B [Enterococcus sulfureus ATCC 49903]